MDDVVRIGRKTRRQSAQQCDKAHLRSWRLRQVVDDRRQCSAVPEPDDAVRALLDDAQKKTRPGGRERLQWQARFAEIGCDDALTQPIARAQLMLEADAFGDRAIDEDMDESVAGRPGDQTLHFERGNMKAVGDLAMRHAAGKIEPSRTGEQAELVLIG